MSETCCTRLAENTGRKKVAKNRHLGTIAQLCRAISSQLRHVSTIGKQTLSRSIFSTCPQNMVNFGPLAAEIDPVVWGSVTARHLVVGVSQTLRRWTVGATYVRQGDHHVGHWPTFLVTHIVLYSCFYCSDLSCYTVASDIRDEQRFLYKAPNTRANTNGWQSCKAARQPIYVQNSEQIFSVISTQFGMQAPVSQCSQLNRFDGRQCRGVSTCDPFDPRSIN